MTTSTTDLAVAIVAGLVGATVGTACMMLGIFALIPREPWKEQDVAAGVCLILFSSSVGLVASVGIFFVLFLVSKMTCRDKRHVYGVLDAHFGAR